MPPDSVATNSPRPARSVVLLLFAERHDHHIPGAAIGACLHCSAATSSALAFYGIHRRYPICLEARLRRFDFECSVFCFLGLGAAWPRNAWNSATASRESHG